MNKRKNKRQSVKQPTSSKKPIKVNGKASRRLGVFGGLAFIALALVNFALGFPEVVLAGLKSGSFGDLYSVLLGIECYARIGQSVYDIQQTQPLGPACTTFYYGSPLLSAGNFLGIGTNWLDAIAWSLISLTAFFIGYIYFKLKLQRTRFGKIVFGAAILLSPPLSLLFERANLDLLIFLLVLASAYFYTKSSPLVPVLLVAISALMKFYTAPLIALLIALSWKRGNKVLLLVIGFGTAISVTLDVLTRLQNPWRLGEAQFGSAVFTHYLAFFGQDVSKNLATVLGGLATALLALVIQHKVSNLPEPVKFNDTSALNRIAVWCLATFIICFFAGYNFDYRLIFLAAAVKAIIPPSSHSRVQHGLLSSLVVLAMWGSIDLGAGLPGLKGAVIVEVLQAFGDLSVTAVVAYSLAVFIKAARKTRGI